jgi:hypothetical protein
MAMVSPLARRWMRRLPPDAVQAQVRAGDLAPALTCYGCAGKGEAAVTQQSNDPRQKPAGARGSPMRLVLPIVLGLGVGSAIYAGYYYWSHKSAEQKALAEAPADSFMAKPLPEDCTIAQAALTALHAAGSDKTWRTAAAATAMTLEPHTRVVNPTDFAGYTDDEADDLRGKTAADWRGCAGMATFITGLGWSAMGGDEAIPAIALGRPAMSKAGDEARIYESFSTPNSMGEMLVSRGPWLVTLHKGAGGAWQVVSTADLKRIKL